VLASILTARFFLQDGTALGSAVWHGVFTSVSAFNNAGFSLWSDSLVGFVDDWSVTLTVAVAIVLGGIGFPVVLELIRSRRAGHVWSLHTKLTLLVTAFLLVVGTAAVLGFEWGNEATLGALSAPDKLLAAFFGGVTPRTAGFNSIDYGEATGETLLVTDILMFIGGGSGSTAGGIKVTTFALIGLMVLSEARGDRHVSVFRRSVSSRAQRQALVVVFVAINAVVLATLGLMATSDLLLYQALFESVSAFGTVGLSTGVTDQLDAIGQSILIVLMFLGRIGPHTLALALVLRERERLYSYPEERPLIG
jgi:trk system potassium uptake protein TrkH